MKAPVAKTTEQTPEQTAPSKAHDALVAIVDLAVQHRYPEKAPPLAAVVRMVGFASRLIHFKDRDERTTVENAAVMSVAKRRGLIS